MQKTQDISSIIAIFILVLFTIFTIIYFFNLTDNNNLENNNMLSYIYHEHEYSADNEIKNVKKTYEQIATYTTNIYDKDENRIHNIKLACEKLDGCIVYPAEEFSFNNTMGSMGEADGYKKAIGFDSKGNKIKMSGGGICQISSTLYNAVLIGNLEVTERHAHSRRVYYVPKDKDATIFYGGPDFKFKNSTSSKIMICTYTDGYTVTVTLKQEKIIES